MINKAMYYLQVMDVLYLLFNFPKIIVCESHLKYKHENMTIQKPQSISIHYDFVLLLIHILPNNSLQSITGFPPYMFLQFFLEFIEV